MSHSQQSLEFTEIQKAINLFGLKFSEVELYELKFGNTVSLESNRLSEIGSIFILAEAISATNSVKNITFRDLLEIMTESSHSSGLPIHYWNSDLLGKCCLLLTLVDNKPAVRFLYQNHC